MSTDRRSRWSTDLTTLCERLAERLRADGAPHPWPAAVALAARGATHQDRQQFAASLGLVDRELGRIEAGDVPFDHWPTALRLEVGAIDGLDVVVRRFRSAGQ